MKKIKILSLILLFLFLLFSLTDVYLLLLWPLDSGKKITGKEGDSILVLGGGLQRGNRIGVSTGERLDEAVRLYKNREMTILVSDGSLYAKSPAIAMFRDYLIEKGVKPEHIRFEGRSQTTYENFIYTRKMLNQETGRVLVLTSPYHQRRSTEIMNYLKLKNYRMAKMDRSEVYQAGSFRQRFRNLRLIFREYFALIKFKIFKR